MSGWLIGVMVEMRGEPRPVRHFFAVGHEDRAKAEWTAIDAASQFGHIASSPVDGVEPVQALGALTPARMKRKGLLDREVRSLGRAWPRN